MNTETALDLIANERAPKYHGNSGPNRAVRCADGFVASVQASWGHYSHDSNGERPAWHDSPVAYPFISFELGYPSEDVPGWPGDECVWGFVPRETVAAILDSHGGVVGWTSLGGVL